MAEPASEPRPEEPRPGPEGLHYPNGILIVEDEADLVRALRINLRARQYEVLTAGTGREALGLGGSPPAGAHHPRPRTARHRRHRGDRRTAAVVPRADYRAVRPDQPRRQDRRAG